jgi:hypothetical protein
MEYIENVVYCLSKPKMTEQKIQRSCRQIPLQDRADKATLLAEAITGTDWTKRLSAFALIFPRQTGYIR